MAQTAAASTWPRKSWHSKEAAGRVLLKNSLIKVNTRDYDLITDKSAGEVLENGGQPARLALGGGHLVIVFEFCL